MIEINIYDSCFINEEHGLRKTQKEQYKEIKIIKNCNNTSPSFCKTGQKSQGRAS